MQTSQVKHVRHPPSSSAGRRTGRLRPTRVQPGVDEETLSEFEADLKGNLYKLWLCRARGLCRVGGPRCRSFLLRRRHPVRDSA